MPDRTRSGRSCTELYVLTLRTRETGSARAAPHSRPRADIDTSKVTSISRADNKELFSSGVPKFGELKTETGEVSIYSGAFESAATLGSVIGHEAESHGSQVAGGRSYAGRKGGKNLGYTINEIEARDYEIRNAERFGTSADYLAKAKEYRETPAAPRVLRYLRSVPNPIVSPLVEFRLAVCTNQLHDSFGNCSFGSFVSL